MPTYSVTMTQPPTSVITTEKRTYTVRFRICTGENECDLYPAAINSNVIRYDEAPCPPEDVDGRPIPAFYDLSFYGCPNEIDAGAVLVSSSLLDEKAEPSQADIDELQVLTGGLDEPEAGVACVGCALYEFVYEADLVDGRSEVGDITENACPEITIEPYIVQEPVEKAIFKGFWTAGACCEDDCGCDDGTNDCVDACSDSIWGFFRDSNWPVDAEPCINAATEVANFDRRIALNEYNQAVGFCNTLEILDDTCLAAAEKELSDRLIEIDQRLSDEWNQCYTDAKAGNEDFDSKPCWSFVSGECGTPRNPNGVPLQLQQEVTEEVITIRHFAEDTGPTDLFRRVTNTVNCSPFSVAIPCQNFYETWDARTLQLKFVRHNSRKLNGSNVWVREYQFHWRKTGWDEFRKVDGVERAVCVDAPEGSNVSLEFTVVGGEETTGVTVEGDATILLDKVVRICDPGVDDEDCPERKITGVFLTGGNTELTWIEPIVPAPVEGAKVKACIPGIFEVDDCVEDCQNIPGTGVIVDAVGNPLRDPIPLDLNGQPDCDLNEAKYTRWQTKCCQDFTQLPIPQVEVVDESRDGDTPPGGPDPPTINCLDANAGATYIVFYKGDQCKHTFTCTCVPPCSWVLTSSEGENCP